MVGGPAHRGQPVRYVFAYSTERSAWSVFPLTGANPSGTCSPIAPSAARGRWSRSPGPTRQIRVRLQHRAQRVVGGPAHRGQRVRYVFAYSTERSAWSVVPLTGANASGTCLPTAPSAARGRWSRSPGPTRQVRVRLHHRAQRMVGGPAHRGQPVRYVFAYSTERSAWSVVPLTGANPSGTCSPTSPSAAHGRWSRSPGPTRQVRVRLQHRAQHVVGGPAHGANPSGTCSPTAPSAAHGRWSRSPGPTRQIRVRLQHRAQHVVGGRAHRGQPVRYVFAYSTERSAWSVVALTGANPSGTCSPTALSVHRCYLLDLLSINQI